ncbi:MAG: hypothetical protein HKM94_11475 [Halobacteria archaeon]|nr:hypothetical protein [Halobacteria archaeon]
MTRYLNACAENGGKATQNIDPFLPWLMNDERRAELARPYPSPDQPAALTESVPILDSS